MVCYSPLKGYRSAERTALGKRKIVFSPLHGLSDMPVTVPCGQCIGCRLERSRQWAMRCYHEASLYDRNCFITLTYNNNHLPFDGSLRLRDFQLFMKRLRKRFGSDIRFYHCGEYGAKGGRPHYHACLFNFDFDDKKLWRVVNEQRLYTSAALSELWPFGFSTVGSVTFESAAYVARYIMKKVTGDAADAHYERINVETGEIFSVVPEYTTMSRRPGIGKAWFDNFASDVYPSDFCVINGKKVRPPRYYDSLYEHEDPEGHHAIKLRRKLDSKQFLDDNTPERLKVRETVQAARLANLKRGYEND